MLTQTVLRGRPHLGKHMLHRFFLVCSLVLINFCLTVSVTPLLIKGRGYEFLKAIHNCAQNSNLFSDSDNFI